MLSHPIVFLLCVTVVFTVIVGLQIARERVEVSRAIEIRKIE
jgi:hypothetical protein